MTLVLSPQPVTSREIFDISPPAGPLRGRRVGIRRDQFWRSWDWVTDEWVELLRRDGAEPVVWRAPVGKGDQAQQVASKDFDDFLNGIDIAIMGLCNCGSCTLWAIHDTTAALDRRISTVAVATEHFERLARMLAGQRGHEEIRVKLMPYPLEGRDESEVREIAREHYDSLLVALGAVRVP